MGWPDWTSGTVATVARAGVIQQARAVHSLTDIPVVAAAETIAVALPGIEVPDDVAVVILTGWAQYLGDTGGEDANAAIRRGAAIADPLVGEQNAIDGYSTPATVRSYVVRVSESLVGVATVSYVLTIRAPTQTGTGTILQASLSAILV